MFDFGSSVSSMLLYNAVHVLRLPRLVLIIFNSDLSCKKNQIWIFCYPNLEFLTEGRLIHPEIVLPKHCNCHLGVRIMNSIGSTSYHSSNMEGGFIAKQL